MIYGEAYVLDVDSIRYKGKYAIKVLAITTDGKKIVLIDNRFNDYFYIIASDAEKMKKFLTDVEGVKEVKIEKMKFKGDPMEVVKVMLEDTKFATKVKEHAKKSPNYIDHVEMDIPTFRRWMIDKKIYSLTKFRFEGEEIDLGYAIKTYLIRKIEPLDDWLTKFKVLAFDIETYRPIGVGLKNVDKPVIIISIYGDGLKKVITTKKFDTKKDYIVFKETEEDLIREFAKTIQEYNPDIIFGYNTDIFDFPYLMERINKNDYKVKLGYDGSFVKFSRRRTPHAKIEGIIHIDLYPFIRNILGATLETENFSLSSVAKELIGEGKTEGVKWSNIASMWENGKAKELCEYCLNDSRITFLLGKKVLPIIIELTKIVGQPMFDVSRMTYSLIDEWFIIKHAHEFDELIPEKPVGETITERFMRTYEGGYVHQPEPGLYENIMVFDFRSLYPSIIISHNICPTTADKEFCKERAIYSPDKKHWFCKGIRGMIPSLLKELVERRIEIKRILKKMKEGPEKTFLEARSHALKTIANSTYGYLGFPRSRWYSVACAESITAFGRYYITKVIESAEKEGFKVIYGDTDSIMILLNGKSKKDAFKFQEKINKELPHYMELDFQGFYPRGIFVSIKGSERGAKKRYALIDENGKIIVKGFEYVRRDWAEIAKKVQIEVIKAVLKDKSVEKAVEIVNKYMDKLRKGKASIDEITIYTQITRPIREYENKGPHVMAVIRAGKEEEYIPGSIVGYIVCKGKGRISDRSYLVEEYKNKNLEYDPEYYINNQIMPAVGKIFEVLGYDIKNLSKKQETLSKFF